jgi:dipeptidyl aminopeptidase/acylaminoacyl peptidase
MTNKYTDLMLPLVDISYDAMRRLSISSFVVIGIAASHANALHQVDFLPSCPSSRHITPLASTFDMSLIPHSFLSTPIPLRFPVNSNTQSHAILMAPRNPNFTAPPNTLPPCIVFVHGGPTKHHRPSINLESQFLTSRGYTVVLLNHAGSTGYGRAHRDRLTGAWGVADVQDAVACVNFLVKRGIVDARRVGITGGSAGGYCTLQSMIEYPEVWAAGVSICGIADMGAFAAQTHKFESRYADLLVCGRERFSKDQEEAKEDKRQSLYRQRSPVHGVRRLRAPVLLLQGTEDKVVPPAQAIAFEEAFRQLPYRNVENLEDGSHKPKVEVVLFEGEGHGFHLEESIRKALEMQERWWRETLVDGVGPEVEIGVDTKQDVRKWQI